MEKQTLKLFPTPVNYYREVLALDQLEAIYQHCVQADAGQHGAFVGDVKSSFGKTSRLIEDLEARYQILKGLRNGLADLLKDYAAELGFENVDITNSWFNIQRPGSVLKHHVHPEARVSGALCIQADEKSSKLFLENPNPFLNLIRPDRYTEATFEFAKFKLMPGDLVLFPSWIKHGSGFEANESQARVVVSINAC